MNISYIVNEIRRKGDDPYWWRQRFLSRVAGPLLGEIHGNDGIDFMEQDWDNLLILDACRADMFQETIGTDDFDSYQSVHSLGCSSPEWMRKTFDENYPDTVYVTGNPWISKVAPDSFVHVENLWVTIHDIDEGELRDVELLENAGAGDIPTIYADMMCDAAREVNKKYPDKRMIVHFFQPHAPCVGNPDGSRKSDIRDEVHPGTDLKEGNVDHDEVWNAYQDNLQYVYQHASELAEDLGGKSVFTADHGELFGEWLWPFPVRGYEHPTGVRHPKLTEVPWATIQHGERREIKSDKVTEHKADQEMIDERLENLGYKI